MTEVAATPEFNADTALPLLREDISIEPGPRDYAGRPTWTVFDPLRNKFFQFDERAFQLISCWHLGSPGAISDAVAERCPWRPTLEDVEHFVNFLMQSELVSAREPGVRMRLQKLMALRRTTPLNKLIHNYLFFRIPLVRPDAWLDRISSRLQIFLSVKFIVFSACVGLVSLAFLLQQWDHFTNTLPWLFTAEGAVVFVLTLAAVKILHEFGHALACKRYGVRVASMGVTFLVMWPVLYTDATDGWRLSSRWQRAIISGAGVVTELMLACYALAFWLLLPDGLARSTAFTVATTTLVMSLVVNLNPFMRFDGYFFLSDILNIPNLQDRSFALARWQLRRFLFGDTEDPPENFPRRMHRFLVWYAWTVWIYRLVLFLGIAVLVYYFFFKALGVFLFLVEIWFFILRPIHNELKHWPGFWQALDWQKRRRWYMVGGVAAVVLLFPWRQEFKAPAQLVDANYSRFFSPEAAIVESVLVQPGSRVEAGAVLMRLTSPELAHRQAQTGRDIARLRSMLERSTMDAELITDRLVLQQDLLRFEAELVALARVADRLEVTAPTAGIVEDLLPDLHPGRWVSRKDHLLTVREGRAIQVTALVPEDRVAGLASGSEALFYGEARGTPQALPLTVAAVEGSAVTSLESPYFAAKYGGEIPATMREDSALVPDISVYRVHLVAEEGVLPPPLRLRGWVYFKGERRTLLGRGFRLVLGTLIREGGF